MVPGGSQGKAEVDGPEGGKCTGRQAGSGAGRKVRQALKK
jgi:hypothetical protein